MASQLLQGQINYQEHEPDAVRALKGISESEDREDMLAGLKFPFKTCRYNEEDQNISNWGGRGTSYQSLLSAVPENSEAKLKTLLQGRRQMGKDKLYKVHQRKYTESIMQNVEKQFRSSIEKQPSNEKRKSQQEYKTRCALNTINPDFVGIPKYQRFQTFNAERAISTRDNRTPRISQQKKCMAIKKIKKELLCGLESRSKLFQCSSTQREKVKQPKKEKLCSEIHLNLQLLNDRESFKQNNPKYMRLASLHNYNKIRCCTIERQWVKNECVKVQGQRMKKSAQFQMLKTLLNREKI